MSTYTTVQGDMWDGIAQKVYGEGGMTGNLMWQNRKHLDTFIFPAGVVLKLPEKVSGSSDAMPPWKRAAV